MQQIFSMQLRCPAPGCSFRLSLALVLSAQVACASDTMGDSPAVALQRPRVLSLATEMTVSAVWSSDEAEYTNSVAFGDVDRDGDLDLAVGNLNDSNRLYGNSGTQLDSTALWSSIEISPTRSVAFGDVDGDGYLDLAAGNYGASNSLYFNTTAGLQTSSGWLSFKNDTTSSVAFGDVDNDGDLDLACANTDGAGKRDRLYDNMGVTLDTTHIWDTFNSEFTNDLAFGDLDTDGDLDLARVTSNAGASIHENVTGVLGRTPAWAAAVETLGYSVALGDADGDGDLDLAAGNRGVLAFSTGVAGLYDNLGTALTFMEIWASANPTSSRDLAFGDLDGDGDLDLAEANQFQSNGMYTNSGGVLDNSYSWLDTDLDDSACVTFGDVDGDGDLDLATGNEGTNPEVPSASIPQRNRLYENTGGQFESIDTNYSDVTTGMHTYHSVVLGDRDADGDLDLAVANDAPFAFVYDNVGGTIVAAPIWTAPSSSANGQSVAFGDIDADGDLDLAIGMAGSNLIYANTSGFFGSEQIWFSAEASYTDDLMFGDVDSDGDLDLAGGSGSGSEWLYRNSGTSLQSSPAWTSTAASNASGVAFGDVDGDGDLDFAVAGADMFQLMGGALLHDNTGGDFGPTPVWFAAGEPKRYHSVAFGDVDSDGDLDLAGATDIAGILVYANKGTALGTTEVWGGAGSDKCHSVALGDMDSDGDLDLVAGNFSQKNRVYRNLGSTYLNSPIWSSSDVNQTSSIALGDLDGDLDLDVVSGNGGAVEILPKNYLYVMRGSPSFGLPHPPTDGKAVPGFIHSLDGTAIAHGIHSSTRLTASPLTVPFTLMDVSSHVIGRIELEYSQGGANWQPGTIIGASTDLTTSPTGVSHSVQWDVAGDCAWGENIYIRLKLIGERRTDLPFPWQRASTYIVSTSYRIEQILSGTDDDGDGFPGCSDCNGAASSCTTDCSDSDGDGIMDCMDLCDDFDGDNYGDGGSRRVGAGSIAVDDCTVDGLAVCDLSDTQCLDLDCNDNDANIHPGVLEDVCDGHDADCDGSTDEDYVVDSSCGSGTCRLNNTPSECLGGIELACLPGSPSETVEVTCTDLIDNDCDGLVDGADESCESGTCTDSDGDGFGSPGSNKCMRGPAFDCNDTDPAIHPEAIDSACNGIDDNCDSIIDDGYVVDSLCGTGYCRDANTASSCVAGVEIRCTAADPISPTDTSCNAIDDDCDGYVDDDFVIDSDCGVGFCQTTNTAASCVDGVETPCVAGTPFAGSDITCDDVDDDCNGIADEEVFINSSCGVGYCQTYGISSSCVGGTLIACQPASPQQMYETGCNDGIDNDCDGATDGADTDCNCADLDADGYDTCDAISSNDTDGFAADCDDSNNVVNPGRGEDTALTCDDGIDQDCDGATDCSDADCLTVACSGCPPDADGDGHLNCGLTPDCDDASVNVYSGKSDSTCDAIDEDCDGSVDEDYTSVSVCGVGLCAVAPIVSTCSAGIETPCTPASPPEPSEVSCGDNFDNDCDGAVDGDDSDCIPTCVDIDGDGYGNPGDPTCPSGGAADCDDTVPNIHPGVIDNTCDAIDDNCNGMNDEDYLWDDSCGVGVCHVFNTPSTCIGGVVTECAPAAPPEMLEMSCADGFDNDCDGSADAADSDCSDTCLDSDGDRVCDIADNCKNLTNTDQLDTDADSLGNVCDDDDDNDSIPDVSDPCPLVATTGTLNKPIAYAIPERESDELAVVTLDGSPSCMVTGAAAYHWVQISGPEIQVSSWDVVKLTFLAPRVFSDSILVFELTVSDDSGVGVPATVTVSVHNTINEAPTADAGPDQVVRVGDIVALTSSGSTDVNVDNIAFRWSQIAGPEVVFAGDATPLASFVAPDIAVTQDIAIELLVRDIHGAMDVDGLIITVLPTTGNPVFVSSPSLVAATGEAYQYDADDSVEVAGELPIIFAVTVAPTDFSIDASGGISWIPKMEGTHEVIITAANDLSSAEQHYWIDVVAAPRIISTPNKSFLLGANYRYDIDGLPEALGTTPLTWSLLASPDDMLMHASTGEIVWVPHDSTPALVTIGVSNAHGSTQQSFQVARIGAVAPYIAATANGLATIGVPYRYDADKFVDLRGVLPGEHLRLLALAGPNGFMVHPTSREVGWVPMDLGEFDISLGLLTDADALLDQYDFTVSVEQPTSGSLLADAIVSPRDGSSPLPVVFDGSGSRGTDGLPILQYRWDTMSGPVLRSASAEVSFVYARPGGYTATLEIWDTLGNSARDKVAVAVLDGPYWPPTARIEADILDAVDSLTTQFNCDCADPDGEILSYSWQFGDGDRSDEPNPAHHFERPGSYTVRLTVEDEQGLIAYDSVTAVVRLNDLFSPFARIETTSIDGNGPMLLELHADTEDRDGVVEFVRWKLPSGSHLFAPDIVVSISPGEHFTVQLEAIDNDGLSGYDERTIVVRKSGQRTPHIVSEAGRTATVGNPYAYDADRKPSVQGDRPMVWSLGRVVDFERLNIPDGMVVNAQTGIIHWIPTSSQLGVRRVTLKVDNGVGFDVQDFVVTVRNADSQDWGSQGDNPAPGQASVRRGCACDNARVSCNGLWVGVLGLLGVWSRKRR